MKTVQLLYSYLLVEKPFMLESMPSSPTKEKRFAYNLYLDMICLIDRLASRIKGKNKQYPLSETRFVILTENDEKVKALLSRYTNEMFPYSQAEADLIEEIRGGLLFKEFEKNKESESLTENFWENVFNAIIFPNPRLNELIKGQPGYSLSGVERMKNMMNETFRNFYSSMGNINDALKTLEQSLQKARNLYMRLLALPVELTRLRLDQLEKNRKKFLATNEDLNPNMKFVNNLVPKKIEENEDFQNYTEKNSLSWQAEDPELLEKILKEILASEIYRNYISSGTYRESEDIDFWRDIFVEIILQNKDFLEYLENKSVFWNDDLEIMGSFVLKTFKRLESPDSSEHAVLPMYKDGENGKDARFGIDLFRYVVKNKELYKQYINSALSQDKWTSERLAFMDVVITMTALAEIINYPEIPLQVSINEYIEIAKSYSSEKSGQFVHGLLASILSNLKNEGIIYK